MDKEKNYALLRAVWILSFCILFLAGGCGSGDKPRFSKKELARIPFSQRDSVPESSGGFVLSVGGETITSDEIIESRIERNGEVVSLIENLRPIAQKNGPGAQGLERFKEQARAEVEQVITTRVLNILLYKEARREAGEDIDETLERLAEAEVREFIARFGGDDARANEVLEQMGMSRQSYKEYLKMAILNQSYAASKVADNRPITYSELLECYDEMRDESFVKPATVKFRLIDIKVALLEVTDVNEDRQEQAQRLGNELIGRIRAGEDFDKLGEKYLGVSLRVYNEPVQPESLEKPYDICVVEAEKMKPGQIRLIETDGHIFIMKLEGKWPKGYKPLEEVQKEVEERIVSERRQKAEDALEAELLRQVTLDEKDEFVDFCLKKIYRMSNE
jgi:hypothetical protein